MEDGSCYKPPIRLLNFHCSPENCKAKPCLLVKKSVVNCKVIVLKVLWASGGNADPLSSLSRTPPSCGPSQIRSTSWTSSVWKTRKCRLKRGMNKIQQVSNWCKIDAKLDSKNHRRCAYCFTNDNVQSKCPFVWIYIKLYSQTGRISSSRLRVCGITWKLMFAGASHTVYLSLSCLAMKTVKIFHFLMAKVGRNIPQKTWRWNSHDRCFYRVICTIFYSHDCDKKCWQNTLKFVGLTPRNTTMFKTYITFEGHCEVTVKVTLWLKKIEDWKPAYA